jgi:hypothetical protein
VRGRGGMVATVFNALIKGVTRVKTDNRARNGTINDSCH